MNPARITREFEGADLGDPRRSRRLVQVVERMGAAPERSLCGACGGWDEAMAAYRLLASPQVTPEKILAPHRRALLKRAASESVLAVIQDTTELDFTRMKHMQGNGPLNDEERRGLYLHSLYVVSEEGLPLGVWDAGFLARSDKEFRGAARRKHLPMEQKESHRWVEGYRRTQALAQEVPHCEVFSISDREGDIYEVFVAWVEAAAGGGPCAQWIIRANQDRALDHAGTPAPDKPAADHGSPDKLAPDKLFAALGSAPLLGDISFEMPAKTWMKKVKGRRVQTSRSARTVRQEVRAMAVRLRAPYRKGKQLPPLTIWAVLAKEVDPPEGEEPICWILLTSCEVTTFATAKRIIALYVRRWDIEVFHRTLKTGCRVEQVQIKESQAVRNALAIDIIIAWRILYLTHLARVSPQLPCSTVFAAEEWQAACAVARPGKPAPRGPPALGEFLRIVARLGGHLGRKGDGAPGAQTIWQGLVRVRDFACAWRAMNNR
jgi:hypothetical protein